VSTWDTNRSFPAVTARLGALVADCELPVPQWQSSDLTLAAVDGWSVWQDDPVFRFFASIVALAGLGETTVLPVVVVELWRPNDYNVIAGECSIALESLACTGLVRLGPPQFRRQLLAKSRLFYPCVHF